METDQRRLQRVLGNLVSNAHKHGRPPVVLTVDGPVITVRDHGDGYPDRLLDHGPQRFRSQSGSGRKTGHGLGLTIAVGQARVLGATLRFSNAPDGGAVAELVLPSATPERRLHQPTGADDSESCLVGQGPRAAAVSRVLGPSDHSLHRTPQGSAAGRLGQFGTAVHGAVKTPLLRSHHVVMEVPPSTFPTLSA